VIQVSFILLYFCFLYSLLITYLLSLLFYLDIQATASFTITGATPSTTGVSTSTTGSNINGSPSGDAQQWLSEHNNRRNGQ
jgi:hypothetical protein